MQLLMVLSDRDDVRTGTWGVLVSRFEMIKGRLVYSVWITLHRVRWWRRREA